MVLDNSLNPSKMIAIQLIALLMVGKINREIGHLGFLPNYDCSLPIRVVFTSACVYLDYRFIIQPWTSGQQRHKLGFLEIVSFATLFYVASLLSYLFFC